MYFFKKHKSHLYPLNKLLLKQIVNLIYYKNLKLFGLLKIYIFSFVVFLKDILSFYSFIIPVELYFSIL